MEEKPDFRDSLYTVDKSGHRKWVYPHYAPGKFFKSRRVVAYSLMLFYLAVPWITVGGKQGVLLDIPNRRFIFLGVELWATDTIFLFLLLSSLAMSLFFFTSILGRVWCGWACPETVFLEFLFRPIERLIEGSDANRRKLDKAPWGLTKLLKKSLKHSLCALASWVIASTTLAYFVGREPLLAMMTHSPLENPVPFIATLFLMSVMAFQFGWFREQFCTVLCPYARFQSVLMDPHSLLVGYDKIRGEPRGKVRGKDDTKKGDCIDCGMCVRVCPTGIDIRNGTQLECIACTACIDACDAIMTSVGRDPGLVRYDTEAALTGRKRQLLRPRLFVYATILLTLLSTFAYKLNHRSLVDIDIVRVAQDGLTAQYDANNVSNQFSLRLANKGPVPLKFSAKVLGNTQIELITPLSFLELKHGDASQVPMFVRAPLEAFRSGVLKATIQITDNHGGEFHRELTIFGPER